MKLLKHLNSIRLPLLPDVLSDLLLMSTSRAEAERLCALEVLSSACCTEVPHNRKLLLDNNLFRQVTELPLRCGHAPIMLPPSPRSAFAPRLC